MKANSLLLSLLLLTATSANVCGASKPISLHPDNPHYFVWRGKPTVLITSGEHYGAVLNLDFDYMKYLDTLAKDKLNNTRTFTGAAYVEPQGAFNIARNTLAPAPGRYIAPWARSDQPGYAGGGNKFDLSRWDEAYFKRFSDFVAHASKRGIVVEVNLFCPFYEETQWRISPFCTNNNVNGVGNVARLNVYSLDQHGGLLSLQERLVRKLVEEFKEFDNVYYEICNEPYFGGVTLEWQHHIADVINEAQKNHSNKKLISQNIANNSAKIVNPHPSVSIFNFHYASPPDTVPMNYHLSRVIGDNETGFRGTNNAPYRMEAWDFLIAGGGLYNNLDYSFTAGHEDGAFIYPASQPGGGNPTFRRQMRVLRDFIESFSFVHMKPDNSILKGGVPPSLTVRALVEPGKAYAIYLRPAPITQFSVRWTGQIEPKHSEEYTFHTFSNDGVRLWVNGKQLINNWTDHGETEDMGRIKLDAGKRYGLRLDYFYNGGQAVAKLWWSSSTQTKEPVPSSALWRSGNGANGLKGHYYLGDNFQRIWQTRDDAQVNFTWGTKPPLTLPKYDAASALEIELPAGAFDAEWIEPLTGQIVRVEKFKHTGGICTLMPRSFAEDIALRIRRR